MTATTVAAVGRRIGATDNGIAAAVSRSLRGRTEVDRLCRGPRDLPDAAGRADPVAGVRARSPTALLGKQRTGAHLHRASTAPTWSGAEARVPSA